MSEAAAKVGDRLLSWGVPGSRRTALVGHESLLHTSHSQVEGSQGAPSQGSEPRRREEAGARGLGPEARRVPRRALMEAGVGTGQSPLS